MSWSLPERLQPFNTLVYQVKESHRNILDLYPLNAKSSVRMVSYAKKCNFISGWELPDCSNQLLGADHRKWSVSWKLWCMHNYDKEKLSEVDAIVGCSYPLSEENPIFLALSHRGGSSQVASAWWGTSWCGKHGMIFLKADIRLWRCGLFC